MEKQDRLIVKQTDLIHISALIKTKQTDIAELLEDELSRASVVADNDLPKDVVSMYSKVVYQDLDSQRETTVTLVYPREANIEENKVSILAPIGAALIGLRVGQKIQWPVPSGKDKNLKVTAVLSQENFEEQISEATSNS